MGSLGRLIPTVLLVCIAASSRAGELDRVRDLRASGDILALEAILESLPGGASSNRVLEAELEEADGMLIYEIELLDAGGRVREYRVNARNGKVLQIEDE